MIGQIIPLDPGARWPDRVEDAALSLLLRRRIVFLRGAIQDTVAGDIAAQLLALDGISSEPITLIIDSPGGDVSGLFTILDTMGILDATVDTKCVGMAASAASVILCAGTGVRSATPNARIMLDMRRAAKQRARRGRRIGEAFGRIGVFFKRNKIGIVGPQATAQVAYPIVDFARLLDVGGRSEGLRADRPRRRLVDGCFFDVGGDLSAGDDVDEAADRTS